MSGVLETRLEVGSMTDSSYYLKCFPKIYLKFISFFLENSRIILASLLPSLSCCCSHHGVSLVAKLGPCKLMDSNLPGFSVHNIFQARILEWVAISFFRGSSQTRGGTRVSCIGRWIPYCLHHLGRLGQFLRSY